jgi:hypothetical protein
MGRETTIELTKRLNSTVTLIEDITDEAGNKDKKTEGGGAHYNGKPDKKSKDKKKGKLCKNCKNLNAFHEPDKCFVTNKKLRQEWEKKTGKMFVPYSESKKSQKSKEHYSNSDTSDSEGRKFRKDSAYLCAHLSHKKNRSPLQTSTLFDTGAETHLGGSIEDFDQGTYTPATLPSIDTAGGEARPLGFGKRTIICATDTDGETHTLPPK